MVQIKTCFYFIYFGFYDILFKGLANCLDLHFGSGWLNPGSVHVLEIGNFTRIQISSNHDHAPLCHKLSYICEVQSLAICFVNLARACFCLHLCYISKTSIYILLFLNIKVFMTTTNSLFCLLRVFFMKI